MDKAGADARREANQFSTPSRAKLVATPKELAASRHHMDLPDARGSALPATKTAAQVVPGLRSCLGGLSGRALVVS